MLGGARTHTHTHTHCDCVLASPDQSQPIRFPYGMLVDAAGNFSGKLALALVTSIL